MKHKKAFGLFALLLSTTIHAEGVTTQTPVSSLGTMQSASGTQPPNNAIVQPNQGGAPQPTPVSTLGTMQGVATGTPPPPPPNNSTFAVTLARQAGAIGGAAQACGQDISLLSARLDEAILASAENAMDISNAVAAYQQSTKESAEKQTAEKTMPCDMVLKDYQKLPLLRDDYKEVVLSAIKVDRTRKPTDPTAPTPTKP